MNREDFYVALAPYTKQLTEVGHDLFTMMHCTDEGDDAIVLIGHHDYGFTRVTLIDPGDATVLDRWEYQIPDQLVARLNELVNVVRLTADDIVKVASTLSAEERARVLDEIHRLSPSGGTGGGKDEAVSDGRTGVQPAVRADVADPHDARRLDA